MNMHLIALQVCSQGRQLFVTTEWAWLIYASMAA